MSLSLS